MKTENEPVVPAQLLSATCAVIAAIHFYNCSGKADFVLLAFVALGAAPWMGDVFESISKDGIKYRQQGSTPAPAVAPAPDAGGHTTRFAAVGRVTPSAFAQLAPQAKKVLATLWKYQQKQFPNWRERRWTFTVRTGSPEYMEFSLGELLLSQKGYIAVAPSGQIMLSDEGCKFCEEHILEISDWPITYDKFSN